MREMDRNRSLLLKVSGECDRAANLLNRPPSRAGRPEQAGLSQDSHLLAGRALLSPVTT